MDLMASRFQFEVSWKNMVVGPMFVSKQLSEISLDNQNQVLLEIRKVFPKCVRY